MRIVHFAEDTTASLVRHVGGDDVDDDGGSARYLKDNSPLIQLPLPKFENSPPRGRD
jgi:hypothetical protein